MSCCKSCHTATCKKSYICMYVYFRNAAKEPVLKAGWTLQKFVLAQMDCNWTKLTSWCEVWRGSGLVEKFRRGGLASFEEVYANLQKLLGAIDGLVWILRSSITLCACNNKSTLQITPYEGQETWSSFR